MEMSFGGLERKWWNIPRNLIKEEIKKKKNTLNKEELDMAVVNGRSELCLYLSPLCVSLESFFFSLSRKICVNLIFLFLFSSDS